MPLVIPRFIATLSIVLAPFWLTYITGVDFFNAVATHLGHDDPTLPGWLVSFIYLPFAFVGFCVWKFRFVQNGTGDLCD